MTLLLSSLGSIAGCVRPEAEGYAATVEGLPGGPPLAYWRLGETSGSQIIDRKGSRHGTYSGTVTAVSGLPQDSDGAIDFGGTGSGEVPHDPGLALSEFSLSLWFRFDQLPNEGELVAIISKDQPGLNLGDFVIYCNESTELLVQFQSASAQHRTPTIPSVAADRTYHLCVRADDTGFDAYLDGSYLGKSTGVTAAWSSNPAALMFAFSPTPGVVRADAIVDEVALYDRVLSEAEVISLSQHTQAPVATSDSFVMPENQTTVLNVVNNDTFVGRKENLTVEIVSQATFGTATVRGDKDIDFAAGAVTQDEADSFTYRITDANGVSNTATVNLTVQNAGSQGGGTLAYDWQASGDWITDDGTTSGNFFALTARDFDNVLGAGETGQPSPNRWVDGASVGGGMVQRIGKRGNFANNSKMCWNFAPDGTPALEMVSKTGQHDVADFWIELYPQMDGTAPRHLRVAMEIKTCHNNDPTTFKAHGQGTTSGSYPHFGASHDTNFGAAQDTAIKYFCCMAQGERPRGAAQCNWWNSGQSIDGVGYMMQSRLVEKYVFNYSSQFDRAGQFGGISPFAGTRNEIPLHAAGYQGFWHRLEIEIKLTTPSLAQEANARRRPAGQRVRPPLIGDGEYRTYLTRDLDGQDGGPYPRELMQESTGIIFNPWRDDTGEFDNMHTLLNLTGPWLDWYFGGGIPAQAEVWAWLRRIQVFRHD